MKEILINQEFVIGHGSTGFLHIPIYLEHTGKLDHKLHVSVIVQSEDSSQDIVFHILNQKQLLELFSYLSDDEEHTVETNSSERSSNPILVTDVEKSDVMTIFFDNRYFDFTDKVIHAEISETWVSDSSPNSVFVITPMGESEHDKVCNIIESECRKLHLKAERANNVIGSKPILENIIRKIKQSEFLIVDLTCEKPNVYYELGYAHGKNKMPENILLIAKRNTILHFDISQSNVEFYDSVNDLHDIVYDKIKNMIHKKE